MILKPRKIGRETLKNIGRGYTKRADGRVPDVMCAQCGANYKSLFYAKLHAKLFGHNIHG